MFHKNKNIHYIIIYERMSKAEQSSGNRFCIEKKAKYGEKLILQVKIRLI